jgi:signal transduction histidine kinase/CheY-like chemotaxis protein
MSNDHQDAYEHKALKKDGTTILVEARGTKTLYKGKQVRVTAIRDITETKRLQELESRAEKLEMAGIIAGQVAHDFNNLLSPILAYPMYIKEELPNDHDAHAYLDAIQNAAGRIAEINQDLLTMGRRAHYNQEALDLNQVVEQIVTEMESRSTTVSVETDLCEDLAPIKGGAAQLHRVLTNLIVNAKDAMDDVGVVSIRTENYYADNTTVVYGAVPKGEYVKLTVSDTGCGIPANVIPKILDPFFSTKTTDKKRGSGLGMSVVDAVIKDHNGYMDLSTKVGEGTSFYVYFPVTTESVQPEVSNEACGGSDTILVVDDDDVQRAVATQLLTKLGYEVNSVESGEKAVEFLRENPRDLVILDMIMPGGSDGAETYRQIIGVSPYQKAIILSGYSASDRVLDVQRMGAGAFVKKPVTTKVLAEAVRKELDRETSPAA